MDKEIKYHIYCDGGARPNPGEAGYGVVVLVNNELTAAYSEYFEYSTNNIMELKAFYKALQLANEYGASNSIIYIDSAYAMNCILSWASNWSINNWLTSKNQPVLNKELIEEIYNYYNENFSFCQPKVEKIKGHIGIAGNELVDALSRKNLSDFLKIIERNKLVINCSLDKIEGMIK